MHVSGVCLANTLNYSPLNLSTLSQNDPFNLKPFIIHTHMVASTSLHCIDCTSTGGVRPLTLVARCKVQGKKEGSLDAKATCKNKINMKFEELKMFPLPGQLTAQNNQLCKEHDTA